METKGEYRVKQRETSFEESERGSKSKFRPPLYTSMSQTDSEGVDLVFWIAVSLSQVVGVVIVSLLAYWCTLYGGFAWESDPNLQFFYHPLLMVLGLIFFYGEAILTYRVLYFIPKWTLKLIHATLQIIAIALSSIGLAAVFENHRRTKKADFYSLHSWLGIATFGFFCLQYVGSFLVFLFPGASSSLRGKMMPFHTFFGLGIFLLAVATAEMGLTERLLWTGNYTSGQYVEAGTVGNTTGLLLVVFAFLVVFLATHSSYKRKPLPSETVAPLN